MKTLFAWRSIFLASCLGVASTVMGVTLSDNHVRRMLILQYHHVSDTTPDATSVTPAMFAEHLSIIEREGFAVWPLQRLVDALQNRQTPEEDVLAITFDDAYQDFATHAWPLLRQKGWPATLFVSTASIGSQSGVFLSWAQLRQLHQEGVTLASHGHQHQHMAHMLEDAGEQSVLRDVQRSRDLLFKETGSTSRLFAYPYGEYSSALAKLLQRDGWLLFGQQSGPPVWPRDREAIPRFPISKMTASSQAFLEKLRTLPFPTSHTWHRPDPFVWQTRPVLQLTTPLKETVRCFASDIGAIPTVALPAQAKEQVLLIRPPVPMRGPRFRYNCTAKGPAGFFFWFSQPWVLRSQPID